jgi:two-component system sensor histidine kinase HydH
MGLALSTLATVQWTQTRKAATSVAEARAMDLFRSVRRQLRDLVRGEGSPREFLNDEGGASTALAELLTDLSDAGLRYLAVVDRGEIRLEAGNRDPRPLPRMTDPPREPRVVSLGERVRLDAPIGPPAPRNGLRLILEVEPLLAQQIQASAEAQLVASVIVGATLVLLAVLFWRVARRAERSEREATRVRHLAELGELTAVLHHELRNPLAALKGHAQLAHERLEPGHRATKNLDRVISESERLERLMFEILDFARNGRLDLAPHDPRALLEAAIARVGGDRIELVDEVASDTRPGVRLEIRIDKGRMEQVLVNLLTNAKDACPEGHIRAIIRREGRDTVFEIRDEGAGFEPDAEGRLDHVFLPFRTSKAQGTGLGLAIARRIVQAHGGSIEASNLEGGGACVTVRLREA